MTDKDVNVVVDQIRRHADNNADYVGFANDVAGSLGSFFHGNSEAFTRFFHTPQFLEFLNILDRRFSTTVDPNNPWPFLNCIPDNIRSELDQSEIEVGLFGMHWGRGTNELLEGLGLITTTRRRARMSLYFDLDDFDPADVAEVVSALSDVYRSIGGDALKIDRVLPFECPIPEGAPA